MKRDEQCSSSSRQVDSDPERSATVGPSKPRLLNVLGPGLITGASDDDPSGIATYSQAGALYGFGLLWTMVVTYPLMATVQEISARIGRTTGRGLAGNIIRQYPAGIVYGLVGLLFCANVINIAANLGAMGDVVAMLAGGPHLVIRRDVRRCVHADAGLHAIHALRRRTEVADDRVVLLRRDALRR